MRDIIIPTIGLQSNGKWFRTVAYRLDHVDIFMPMFNRGRVLLDGLPTQLLRADFQHCLHHLPQREACAFDLATQTVKWNVPVATRRPACHAARRQTLLVSLTARTALSLDAKDGRDRSPQTGQWRHGLAQGYGRHWL